MIGMRISAGTRHTPGGTSIHKIRVGGSNQGIGQFRTRRPSCPRQARAFYLCYRRWDGSGVESGSVPKAVIKVDNSQTPNAANGAVYKGATIAEIGGQKFILAANFRSGNIDVFNTNFQQVHLSANAFQNDGNQGDQGDTGIPGGFAPFNVQGIGPNLYVTYAKQDAARHDPVAGAGPGFVNVFDSNGDLIQRLAHINSMNAPWAWSGRHTTSGSSATLVGQFRGGNISAFNPVTGRFLGNMLNPNGSTLLIDGLWALRFGNDGSAGRRTTLFFTAGPNGERTACSEPCFR